MFLNLLFYPPLPITHTYTNEAETPTRGHTCTPSCIYYSSLTNVHLNSLLLILFSSLFLLFVISFSFFFFGFVLFFVVGVCFVFLLFFLPYCSVLMLDPRLLPYLSAGWPIKKFNPWCSVIVSCQCRHSRSQVPFSVSRLPP